MKFRQGFVSNSSSTSFIVILDDSTRHLAHYNWQVIEEEYMDTKPSRCKVFRGFFKDGEYVSLPEEEYLVQEGFTITRQEDRFNVWTRTMPMYKTTETAPSRNTSICMGQDLLAYIKLMKGDDYVPAEVAALEDAIQTHGLANVLFLRESDEGMGGSLPPELNALTLNAFWSGEYH